MRHHISKSSFLGWLAFWYATSNSSPQIPWSNNLFTLESSQALRIVFILPVLALNCSRLRNIFCTACRALAFSGVAIVYWRKKRGKSRSNTTPAGYLVAIWNVGIGFFENCLKKLGFWLWMNAPIVHTMAVNTMTIVFKVWDECGLPLMLLWMIRWIRCSSCLSCMIWARLWRKARPLGSPRPWFCTILSFSSFRITKRKRLSPVSIRRCFRDVWWIFWISLFNDVFPNLALLFFIIEAMKWNQVQSKTCLLSEGDPFDLCYKEEEQINVNGSDLSLSCLKIYRFLHDVKEENLFISNRWVLLGSWVPKIFQETLHAKLLLPVSYSSLKSTNAYLCSTQYIECSFM